MFVSFPTVCPSSSQPVHLFRDTYLEHLCQEDVSFWRVFIPVGMLAFFSVVRGFSLTSLTAYHSFLVKELLSSRGGLPFRIFEYRNDIWRISNFPHIENGRYENTVWWRPLPWSSLIAKPILKPQWPFPSFQVRISWIPEIQNFKRYISNSILISKFQNAMRKVGYVISGSFKSYHWGLTIAT